MANNPAASLPTLEQIASVIAEADVTDVGAVPAGPRMRALQAAKRVLALFQPAAEAMCKHGETRAHGYRDEQGLMDTCWGPGTRHGGDGR